MLPQARFADIASALCAKVPREAALIHALSRRSGVESRHSVLATERDGLAHIDFYERGRHPSTAERMRVYEREAPALALDAVRSVVGDASTVTHLITVSCTGCYAPGIDRALIAGLGMRGDVARLNIGFMGCHGALNALAAARAIALGQPDARVLAVCVELCTLHFQFGLGRDDMLPNTLFGDGAAAFVASARGESAMQLLDTASVLVPDSEHAMSWRIGDSGFRMTLDSEVPAIIQRTLRAHVAEFLSRNGLTIDSVAGWAIHPGGPRILECTRRALGIADEAMQPSVETLRDCGNMSSPTALFILEKLATTTPRPSGPVVVLAFGPGLVAEMALLSFGAKMA